jgi:hypothetical protein
MPTSTGTVAGTCADFIGFRVAQPTLKIGLPNACHMPQLPNCVGLGYPII